MKKLCFLLLCCAFAATSLAQSEYRQAADIAFANVDKSGVRSGVLYDRVFPGGDLQNFNATTPSSAEHYLQARSELYEATLYDVANQLTVEELKSLIWQNEKRGVVPVGVTLAEFEVINYDVLELDNNQQYRLKPGQSTANLYQSRKATIAALLSPTVGRGTNYFELPAWSVLSTGETEVSSIVIDFGDGNPTRTLTVGSRPVSATYQNVGQKTIRYTINLSDGSQQTALSTLTVNETARVTNNIVTSTTSSGTPVPARDDINLIEPLSVESFEPFQGYGEHFAWKGKGEAFIYYARGRTTVRKPVIILDGFDPGDTRSAQDIYAGRLRYEKNPGDFKRLGDELRESGADNESDVIILNFPQYEYNCG